MKTDVEPARLFSAGDFRLRAAHERGCEGDVTYGDHRWNPDFEPYFLKRPLQDAAVLVPVVDHGDQATVLLTKRSERLKSHSGQVAFPGGRLDAVDASHEEAALREAEEEIGLDRRFVEIIGRMPDYVSGSGYRIAPVLSVVRPGFLLTMNREEVDDAFEVPLSFLMNPANHAKASRIWENRRRFFYVMPYGERNIWGVTAGIIRTLYERLYA